MFRNILFVLFIFFTSFVFCQNDDSRSTEEDSGIKNSTSPKLIAFDKSEGTNTIKEDTLPKPVLKLFVENQINTNSKKIDSTIISEPQLIPYTGYKKEDGN